MLKATPIVRKFVYNGVTLPDPNPALGIDGVRDVLANTHPEIANAAIDGPVTKGAEHTYTFVRSVGQKG